MAKLIPKMGSHRIGRIGSHKNGRRIPKGVIHVQVSFNNTIVTVTDVRSRVLFARETLWHRKTIFSHYELSVFTRLTRLA